MPLKKDAAEVYRFQLGWGQTHPTSPATCHLKCSQPYSPHPEMWLQLPSNADQSETLVSWHSQKAHFSRLCVLHPALDTFQGIQVFF